MTREKKFFSLLLSLALLVLFLLPYGSRAEVFTSSSFKLLDPEINTGAERSTSASYIMLQSLGSIIFSTSTSASFQIFPGFLAFPEVSIPTVTPTAGDAQVSLSWTAATGALGWSVSGYNIGQSTTAGGPYSYSSVGSVTSSTRTSLTNGTTYYFVVRPEDAFGNSIATSTEVSSTPVAAPVPPPSPPPSGGGGGGILPDLVSATLFGSFLFSGVAYPDADVTILIDGEVEDEFNVGSSATFSKAVTVESGSHAIGIFAVDVLGNKSLTLNFSGRVVGSARTTVAGIVVPPTIFVDAENTAPRTLLIGGSSFPTSTVSVVINSSHEIINNLSLEGSSLWQYQLDTRILEEGSHGVKAKTIITGSGAASIFSETLAFELLKDGIEIAKKRIAPCGIADFNCDGVVNLIDFSILLFNWGIPSNTDTDLSFDGKVDITDFSIMLFYWAA